MNVCTQNASALSERIRLLAAVAVGLFVLAWVATPSTVLASSASEQYIEPEVPTVPDKNSNPGKNGSTSNVGGSTTSDDSSGETYSGDDGTTSEVDDPEGVGSSGKKKQSSEEKAGKDEPDAKKESKEKEDEDKAAAAALSDSDGGGGNSTLILVVALLVGVPLLVGGGYALYRRFSAPDDETRNQLRSAVGSVDSPTPDKSS